LGLDRLGRQCQFCTRTPEGFEPLAEAGSERAVIDRTSNLQQQVGASSRPAHLLRLVHPPIDQEVRRPFRHGRANSLACTVSFGVVDEPGALAVEVAVDLVQCVPQLSGCHTPDPMTTLTPEHMHDFADPVERELGILRLAVPDSPVQPVDFRDNRCLRRQAPRLVGGQSARRQLRMLQPHGDVEPVGNRLLRDAGVGENRLQACTAVGERGHRGTGGSTDCVKAPADQGRDVRFRSRDSTEHLPPTFPCLDIADANLEMPFAIVVAANEGRVRGDGDAPGNHGH
jgi:hypothetical protein